MPGFEHNGKKYNNPVELALDVIGGKWKMPILWRLNRKVWRYGELRKDLGIITHKMLTEQLKELEKAGLIDRKVYPVVPPKVEYRITSKGKTIVPVIESLREWGDKFKNEKLIPQKIKKTKTKIQKS
ncbi:MAG TPA: helix-turn-helix domain-containing protein [Ignavibacteria bacterium]|nr:helix-turn-helix domain-containing protein [Ignavibacteria bacterium]HMR39805.1 helix-turn-helix domain-containing protein [Ignavibacteria bacterium]